MTAAKLWQNGWIIGEKDNSNENSKKNDVTTCPQIVNIQVDLRVIQD